MNRALRVCAVLVAATVIVELPGRARAAAACTGFALVCWKTYESEVARRRRAAQRAALRKLHG